MRRPNKDSQRFKPSQSDTSTTSLDFDDSGEFLLAACDDDSLQLYNAKEGTHVKTLFSKKYGAHLARFTHHAQSVLYASTKAGDDTIRYLSTHDNQYIRYFRAHTAAVTTIAVSPASDTFLSCSLDDSVRLWSVNSPNPQGKLALATPYLAAFDPSATVIAIASTATSSILLYDLRNYDKAPFATFDLRPHELTFTPASVARDWSKLEFSNDGKSLLVGANGPGHFLLDAFSGDLKAFCARRPGSSSGRVAPSPASAATTGRGGVPGQGDVCFSADGKYVVGGSGQEKDLLVWDTQGTTTAAAGGGGAGGTGGEMLHPCAQLPHPRRSAVVLCNPRYNMLASADREVLFWLPDEHVRG